MKVKIGDKEYVVYFDYDAIPARETGKLTKKSGNRKKLKVTNCYVEEKADVSNTKSSVATKTNLRVGEGTAVQHYNDRENSIIGRKIAFTRAISPFNKEDRTHFWDEYKKTTRYK